MLQALPLFPLSTVLFPGGLLPLQVFEVRYLDLMNRCEQSGEPFGVIGLRSGDEVRRAPRPGEAQAPGESLLDVGTAAQIERLTRPQAGLMGVLARGTRRFRLHRSHALPHGLWMGEVEWLPDDLPAPCPDELRPLSQRLLRLREELATEVAGQGDTPVEVDLPAAGDPRWQDAGWVANRWAERLPLPLAERQRLMTLDNPVWRLELVGEWLERLHRAAS
ncbi:MAG: LON peptidase substrate-binding domain-containing protein [Burkholderiales bacterium]|nr:LON peptidase substrate-binding domain-containing protein [Burkholderiales bacterium]